MLASLLLHLPRSVASFFVLFVLLQLSLVSANVNANPNVDPNPNIPNCNPKLDDCSKPLQVIHIANPLVIPPRPAPESDEMTPDAAAKAAAAMDGPDLDRGKSKLRKEKDSAAANVQFRGFASRAQTPVRSVNWYFLGPAFLVLVALGLIIRSYAEHTKRAFDRLDDEEKEEINPFCENQEEDDDEEEMSNVANDGGSKHTLQAVNVRRPLQ